MWTALGVLAALRERDRTGEGSHVVTSLLETAVAWMAYHVQGHLAAGEVPGRTGSGLGMIAPYEAFPASDGHVMIAAGNDGLFRRLFRALGLDELADDERFATNADRVAHRDALTAAVARRVRGRAGRFPHHAPRPPPSTKGIHPLGLDEVVAGFW